MRGIYSAVVVAVAVAVATPVSAQDTAADFHEAYTRTWGEEDASALSAAVVGLSVLTSIAGTWVDGAPAMRGPDLDPEILAGACGFGPVEITNVGDFGFRVELVRQGEFTGNSRTYMFSTGAYYGFTTDLNGMLRMFTDNAEISEYSNEQIFGWLGTGTSGVARVEAVGPDVLMIDSPDTAPQVLVRCP